MRDELYIDNKTVDIDDNTNITLNYKSNLFTEVSKIVSNNTYSIKLPMTVRNCKVIEHAHLPTCSTRFPRINHKGRYLRNGVEIVSDASVTLMEVSDSIDIAMAWGNVSAFAEIVNGDKTLQDLSYGMVENEDYIVWSKELGNSPRLPWLSYGFREGEPNAWFHPAVSAKWILDKISKDSGVEFVIPESRQNFVEQLVIPLLTRNDAQKQMETGIINLVCATLASRVGAEDYRMMFVLQNTNNYYIKTVSGTGSLGEKYTFGIVANLKYMVLSLDGSIEFTIGSDHILGNVSFKVLLNNKKELLSVSPKEIIDIGNGCSKIHFVFNGLETLKNDSSGNVDGDIIFIIQGINNALDVSDLIGEIKISPRADVIVSANSNTDINNRYYYVPNLPDMKQIDFIKAIASLCGMFAIPNENGIRFITMDEIVDNKFKALNWTKRVVASYPQNRPKLLAFSLDNFAQKNIYKWKDDEEKKNDGIIYVDDKTLDEEAEAVTLPFASSEIKSSSTGPYTEIPLYSYNENGELEYKDNLKPRLLIMKNETVATFEGLDWTNIIATQYKMYQQEVREPKVITELIEIPDYELKKLDMSVPIYLGQYGKFYAIISIKAEKTGICECKLFQL